ncbi:MAG: hypothetical protein NTV80_05290, partial [Verrucomicrobia bacterium]|nr:hypothetical protein [Verrucomicrobiota bacterium]
IPVRFVYEVPSPAPGEKLGWSGSLDVPPPTLADVGVLETRHRLYLPDQWHYTSFAGPLTRIASERGWGSVRRVIDPLLPAFGPNLSALERSVWRDPPSVPQDLRTLYGLQVPQQGHLETLRRLGAPADITLGFRGKKVSYFWNALAFLIALLVGLKLWKAPLQTKMLYLTLGGVGSLLLTGLLGPANIPVALSIMLGVGAIAGLWFSLGSLSVAKAIFKRKPMAAIVPPVPVTPTTSDQP